jgi:hypothetical protein
MTIASQTVMSTRRTMTCGALLGALLWVGCGAKLDIQASSGSGGTAGVGGGGGTSGGSGGGASDAGGQPPQPGPDAFACNLTIDCVLEVGHLGPIPAEDLRCGGKLVASGKKGALLITSDPGPYPSHYETLVVLRGDGTQLRQGRSKCATDTGCDGRDTTAWKRTVLMSCTVRVDPASISGCDTPAGPCSYEGDATDCTPVATDWTCAQL